MERLMICKCESVFEVIGYGLDERLFYCSSPTCSIFMVCDMRSTDHSAIILYACDDECMKNKLIDADNDADKIKIYDQYKDSANDHKLISELIVENMRSVEVAGVMNYCLNMDMIKDEHKLSLINKYGSLNNIISYKR